MRGTEGLGQAAHARWLRTTSGLHALLDSRWVGLVHDVQVQEVIAQAAAAKYVIAQVAAAAAQPAPAPIRQIAIPDKPARQVEPAPAKTAPAQAHQIAMCDELEWT